MFNFLGSVVYNSINSQDRFPLVGSTGSSMSTLFAAGINIVLAIGFSLSIIGLGYACVLYIMSSGDPKAIQKAGSYAVYSVIGALVVFLAFAIKTVLINALGIQEPSLTNALPNF
jgi:hypothetical protein